MNLVTLNDFLNSQLIGLTYILKMFNIHIFPLQVMLEELMDFLVCFNHSAALQNKFHALKSS